VPKWREIRDVTKESTGIFQPTLISGGFPCQPFSCAGKQKGKTDDRYLWPEMLRVIREFEPRWVVGENVPGVIKIALDEILDSIEAEGYATQTYSYPVSLIGACHKRERIFIVAHNNKIGFNNGELERERVYREEPTCNEDRECSGNAAHGNNTGSGTSGDGDIGNGQMDKQEPGGFAFDRISGSDNDATNSWNERSGDITNKITNENGRTSEDWREGIRQTDGEISPGGVDTTNSDVANLHIKGLQGYREYGECAGECVTGQGAWQESWIEVATRLCGVDDGIPRRVDRLKCLGNAVVPQQIYPILKAIAEIEKRG
jgi:DNA (cytosine-5)-methyltransferase 1